MQQVNKAYDPAPSRVKYKLHRLWLTPVYRALIRTGLPVLLIFVALMAWLRDPDVQQKIVTYFENAQNAMEERPEFMVQQMRIQGASEPVDKLVRDAMNITFPASSFRLDLPALKTTVEDIEAVETVSILVGAKGVLQVGIVERVPALLWRNDDGLTLLDAQGVVSGRVDARQDRGDLPLVAGLGVEQNIAEALEIFQKLAPIAGRVRGLMRKGERRWNVVLDRGQVLMLPEDQPIAALGRILALHRAQDILNRDILVVDIRDGRKPILRLSAPALDGFKKLRLTAAEEDN
ncbi:MAG: cell division protein FtsQ [Amylibacter sp.]|nr:cell division protein FtsQ [Amylibacter sp.]